MNASRRHRRHLACGRALAAADDRASMAHASSRRRRLPRDECHHRLRHVLLDELRRLLLRRAADLADQDDRLGVRIVVRRRSASMKVVPMIGSPPMPIAVDCPMPRVVTAIRPRRSACPSATRSPPRPSVDRAGMMPTLDWPGEIRPGQFGPTGCDFAASETPSPSPYPAPECPR